MKEIVQAVNGVPTAIMVMYASPMDTAPFPIHQSFMLAEYAAGKQISLCTCRPKVSSF